MVRIFGTQKPLALSVATVKVAECYSVVLSLRSPKPSALLFATSSLPSPPRLISPQGTSNKLFHRIKQNTKLLGALAVIGAAELGLENTESSFSGQNVATLSNFKSNVTGLITQLRVG